MEITLHIGDITTQDVDAVVNAANPMLAPGGGVCGAIFRAAGADVFEDAQAIRHRRFPSGVPAGEAVVTAGGRMRAKFIVHAVGPVYDPRVDRSDALRSAYRRAIAEAAHAGARTIAFPAISAGIYGWPLEDAARQAVAGVRSSAADVDEVRFVLFSEQTYDAFARALAESTSE